MVDVLRKASVSSLNVGHSKGERLSDQKEDGHLILAKGSVQSSVYRGETSWVTLSARVKMQQVYCGLCS